ncbi:hypothetical protein CTAYLR_008935 [Chrysophaeum taylorii]|uniref:Serine/threonine-protein phosphatase 2A 55 kDa regulatory subunit B n=1 Tax=Chrysophaeum taylorii TaxID=2483200 RepID=A0AAD7UJ31_9STRA|nr:hypothetical protein CTAYLR_008935 [Chrysophaeum taylorii]
MDKVTTFRATILSSTTSSRSRSRKINKVKFCLSPATLLLTTNDKTIKLWRVGETATYSADRQKRSELDDPSSVFGNAHAYNVNSISLVPTARPHVRESSKGTVNLFDLRLAARPSPNRSLGLDAKFAADHCVLARLRSSMLGPPGYQSPPGPSPSTTI